MCQLFFNALLTSVHLGPFLFLIGDLFPLWNEKRSRFGTGNGPALVLGVAVQAGKDIVYSHKGKKRDQKTQDRQISRLPAFPAFKQA